NTTSTHIITQPATRTLTTSAPYHHTLTTNTRAAQLASLSSPAHQMKIFTVKLYPSFIDMNNTDSIYITHYVLSNSIIGKFNCYYSNFELIKSIFIISLSTGD
ncbi:unnamed protein product, partial [Adineta steineri]